MENKPRPGIVKLIEDARAKGYIVIEPSGYQGFTRVRKSKRGAGIDIWPDGVAFRCDIDISLCLTIRTIKQMREILDLGEA